MMGRGTEVGLLLILLISDQKSQPLKHETFSPCTIYSAVSSSVSQQICSDFSFSLQFQKEPLKLDNLHHAKFYTKNLPLTSEV